MTINSTILVVDDESHIRQVLSLKLTHAGWNVITAVDGEDALHQAIEHRPDLVITDIRMPNMDGTALLKALRNIAPNLPVLALSGYVDPGDIAEFDFDGFIKKPFKLDEFRTIVDHTVSKVDT